MSIRVMTVVWDSDLETTKKFILLYYADRGSDEGENIWPSVATVAKKTGYSERTVQRVTNAMLREGLLIPDGKGPKGTNRYKIALSTVQNYHLQGGGDTVTPPQESQGGDIDARKTKGGVTLTPSRGDTVTPEPSLTTIKNTEPSIKSAAAFAASIPKRTRKVRPDSPEPDWRNLTPLQAGRIPEIALFIRITDCHPGRSQLPLIYRCIREHQFTVDYLHPFWDCWISHGWKPNNLAWLLEWAVAGMIPEYKPICKETPLDRSQKVLQKELQEALWEEANV